MENRSAAKDALAWTILHGGWLAAKTAIITGAVAAGLLDKYAAKHLAKRVSQMAPQLKKAAWAHYERTGKIWEMIEIAAGSSPDNYS